MAVEERAATLDGANVVLHRSVEGSEMTVASRIESVIVEAVTVDGEGASIITGAAESGEGRRLVGADVAYWTISHGRSDDDL